jgi:hypothetical protein
MSLTNLDSVRAAFDGYYDPRAARGAVGLRE